MWLFLPFKWFRKPKDWVTKPLCKLFCQGLQHVTECICILKGDEERDVMIMQ